MAKVSVLAVQSLAVVLTFLPTRSDIRGIVIEDHSGNPITGAIVSFYTASRALAVETDVQGAFVVPGASLDASSRIEIHKPNYLPLEVRFSSANPDRSTLGHLQLRLVKRGAIRGRMVGSAGKVVAIPVGSHTAADPALEAIGVSSEFRIGDVPLGQYRLALLNPTSVSGERLLGATDNILQGPLVIAGGTEVDVTVSLALQAGVTVSGQIDPITGGVRTTLVLASDIVPGIPLYQRPVSADGKFAIRDVLPGKYQILVSTVSSQGERLFGRTNLEVQNADVRGVNVRLEKGRSLRVEHVNVAGKNNECEPMPAIRLSAVEAWRPEVGATFRLGTGVQDVRDIPFGRYRLRVGEGGVCHNENSIEFLSAESVFPVSTSPPGAIAGQQRLSERAIIVLRNISPGRESLLRTVIVDPEEQFSFLGLSAGEYVLGAFTQNDQEAHWVNGRSMMTPVRVTANETTHVLVRRQE